MVKHNLVLKRPLRHLYGSCSFNAVSECSLSFQEPHSIPLFLYLISLAHSHNFIHSLLFFQHHVSLPPPPTHTFPPALISCPSWNQTLKINNLSVQRIRPSLTPHRHSADWDPQHCNWKHTDSQGIMLHLHENSSFQSCNLRNISNIIKLILERSHTLLSCSGCSSGVQVQSEWINPTITLGSSK